MLQCLIPLPAVVEPDNLNRVNQLNNHHKFLHTISIGIWKLSELDIIIEIQHLIFITTATYGLPIFTDIGIRGQDIGIVTQTCTE